MTYYDKHGQPVLLEECVCEPVPDAQTVEIELSDGACCAVAFLGLCLTVDVKPVDFNEGEMVDYIGGPTWHQPETGHRFYISWRKHE